MYWNNVLENSTVKRVRIEKKGKKEKRKDRKRKRKKRRRKNTQPPRECPHKLFTGTKLP
jgi:hypothetical protein